MQFPHSMENQLRNLGLPTLLKGGTIHLMGDTTVCTKGVPLTVEAAQLLVC
jgi:mRNA turnover protein 4